MNIKLIGFKLEELNNSTRKDVELFTTSLSEYFKHRSKFLERYNKPRNYQNKEFWDTVIKLQVIN